MHFIYVRVYTHTLLFHICETLGKLFSFSRPQFYPVLSECQ